MRRRSHSYAALLLFVVCAVQCVYSTSSGAYIRGVHPRDVSLFKNDVFTCRRNPGKKIPISYVNDNYCDCEDGSDEPGTSACKTGSFFCINKGHTGQNIFSSRVNDGICDCCDGSDEYEGRVSCINTCEALGAVVRKQQQEEKEKYERGLKTREQWVAEAQEGIKSKREEVEKYTQDIDRASQVIKDLEAEKAGFEEKEKAERDAMELQRVAAKQQRDLERQQKEAEELERIQREGPPPTEAPSPTPLSEPSTEGAEVPIEVAEGEGVQDSSSQEPPEPPLEDTEALKAILEDKSKVEGELGNARRDLGDAERRKKTLEEELSHDYGLQSEFFHLLGKCFDHHSREYTYTFCPFGEVKQGSTSLGKYENWEPAHTVMKFTNGLQCWGGPKRSAAVTFVCGDNNELLEVSEPSKCEYAMKFSTPGACNSAFLELMSHSHNEGEEEGAHDHYFE